MNTNPLVTHFMLVTNIGFHSEATHTRDAQHPFAELPARGISFPLGPPSAMIPDDGTDSRRAAEDFLRRLPLVGPARTAWREPRR